MEGVATRGWQLLNVTATPHLPTPPPPKKKIMIHISLP